MQSEVDLRELMVDRGAPAAGRVRGRRHLLTRYILPAILLLSFAGVMAWAFWDALLPARRVTVVPVHTSQSAARRTGTPLFKSAGWVEPRPTPDRVAALAAGVVRELNVVDDQWVKAGDPVATLIDDEAKLALRTAEAELFHAKHALPAAESRFNHPVHLEAQLAEADAMRAKTDKELANLPFEIRRAKSRLSVAEEDLAGKTKSDGVFSGLAKTKAQSDVDEAQATVDELSQRHKSLEQEVRALTARSDALRKQLELKTTETKELADAQARVELAKVTVDEAKLRVERMTVRSQIDGRVLRLVAFPGTHVQPGEAGTVVTLYHPQRLQLRVDVRFENLPRVHQGQKVSIASPAVAKPLEGEVLRLSSVADIQKNTLEAKVVITSPTPMLRPEMLVEVTFLATASVDDDATAQELRFYVPKQLVENDEEGQFVWLADQSSGVARRTRVETAPATDGLVEITSGLSVGSRLISGPREGLCDGDRIVVTGEDENITSSE